MGILTVVYFDEAGQVVGKSTNTYDTMDAAEIQFHVALASAMQKTEYSKVIALIINDLGEVKMRRVWTKA